MADNSRAINRVFTRNVLNELIKYGSSDIFDFVVEKYVINPEIKTNGQIISEIYILEKNIVMNTTI